MILQKTKDVSTLKIGHVQKTVHGIRGSSRTVSVNPRTFPVEPLTIPMFKWRCAISPLLNQGRGYIYVAYSPSGVMSL